MTDLDHATKERLGRRATMLAGLSVRENVIEAVIAISAGVVSVATREGLEAWRGDGYCQPSDGPQLMGLSTDRTL